MRLLWLVVVSLCALVSSAEAQLVVVGDTDKDAYLRDGDGAAYLGVWVRGADGVQRRPPISVALVVDTSGSMSGEKIRHARHAVTTLLEALHDGDLVSLYGFSDEAYELLPPTVVHEATRVALVGHVEGLHADGSTNLHAGLSRGLEAVTRSPTSHPVRRVFLVSDGLANVGPSRPEDFATLAANGTEAHVQVTAIGVGLDYSEETLGAMVLASAGRLYHLANPAGMADILQGELSTLAATVATEVHVEILPGPGVRFVRAMTLGMEVRGGRLEVDAGAMARGGERPVLVELAIDTRQAVGERVVAVVRVRFRAVGEAQPRVVESEVRAVVTDDVDRAAVGASAEVAALASATLAADARLQASAALARDDVDAAERAITVGEASLDRMRRSLAQAPEARRRVEREATELARARERNRQAATARERRARSLELHDESFEANAYR